jgi:hypothetical protein
VRREWLKSFKQHLWQGKPMVHLVAFYCHDAESERFGLVNDAYLYEEALEKKFCLITEREINAKVLKGETLNETVCQCNRALEELSIARRLPEEDRWAWKTIRFSF